jgi:superfamily II DNA or RNA helicase
MTGSNVMGDAVAHYRRLGNGGRAIAFCVSVDHANKIAEQFRQGDYTCETLEGSLDPQERKRIVDSFRSGSTQVLTSCELVAEGFDLPAIEVGLLLRPTRSLSKFLQMCGRCLRTSPGKQRAIILDHAGNTQRFGLPQDDREWSLCGVVRGQRRKTVSDAQPSLRICPACFAANGANSIKCAECGNQFPQKPRKLQVVDGDLREVKSAPTRRKIVNPADNLDGLIALGKMRGYRNPEGWARHILAARLAKKGTEQHG